MLEGGDSLGGLAFCIQHLAQFQEGIGIFPVKVGGFAQGGLGRRIVLLIVEESSAEQIVECAAIRNLGDLSIGGGDRFVGLFLHQVGVHQSPQSVGIRGIDIKRFLVGLGGAVILLLNEAQVALLNVSDGTLGSDLDGLVNVLLGCGELLLVDI